jgi:hypothetical protein
MTIKEFLDGLNARQQIDRPVTIDDCLVIETAQGSAINAKIVNFDGKAGLSYQRQIRSSPAEYGPHRRLATKADIENFFGVIATREDIDSYAAPISTSP